MLLKSCLASSEWLNACVAIERIFVTTDGIKFNKAKSVRIAKRVIVIVLLVTSVSHLQDPLNRELIDDFDADEQRTWCYVRYSSQHEIINQILMFIHLRTPFSINLTAAGIIIVSIARNRSTIQRQHSFKQHLISATLLLVILALPRCIISLIGGCMKSTHVPWLLLFGYFVSFVPSMLTFGIFIIPLKTYKKDFNTAIQKIKRQIQIRH